jgi:alkylation response protein AidB-like acyl-CoA dehydrogenase
MFRSQNIQQALLLDITARGRYAQITEMSSSCSSAHPPAPSGLSRGKRAHVQRELFDEQHDLFRASFRTFLQRHALPHWQRWEEAGIIDRSFYEEAGRAGFLGMAAPHELGGGGEDDFRFNVVILEECQRLGLASVCASLAIQNDVCLPYFLNFSAAHQRARWVPGLCSGQLIAGIAMTEPNAGSDLAVSQPRHNARVTTTS